MKKINRNIGHYMYFLLAILFFWVAVSNIIQAFKCVKMSQTELFLHIPKSFIGNWDNCK